ncbi:MAG TPA: cis-3-hydroxy-L-proline dehydratase [Planctomycetota bacterium]
MKITRVTAHRVELPLREGAYRWADGLSISVFDSTVVRVETDAGLCGVGEICPLGPAYLPAYAAGARAGIAELAPGLLGEDPRQLDRLNLRMDALLKGHPYAKSAIDVACWDLLGQAAGLPVHTLLGGKLAPSVPLYRAISQDEPDRMAARVSGYRDAGYRNFQLKVGGDVDADVARIRAVAARLGPGERLIADANTGWLAHEAIRVARRVSDLDVYLEQPCRSYAECLAVRRATGLPLVLDEIIESVDDLARGRADGAMDAVNIKIGRVGGLTKARRMRDACVALGFAVTLEDSWGGDVATSAIAHLAQSTPPEFLLSTTDFNGYVTVSTADGAPRRDGGTLCASDAPGLGLRPKMDVLGPDVLTN